VDFYFSDSNGSGGRPAIRPDGFYIGNKKVTSPALSTAITFNADGTGFTAALDGISDSWTWVKDANGRITQLTSATGRTVTVTY